MEHGMENNQVYITGEVVSEFTYSHKVFGERFYLTEVQSRRLSESCDRIPVLVSEQLFDVEADYLGKSVRVLGQFRSYNQHREKKSRLILSVFARDIFFSDEPEEEERSNQIFLDGFLCKLPVYRKTPKGREISDMMIAVNRPYGKSDYIPCICWGRTARYTAGFAVGGPVQVWGRIQSREYVKKTEGEPDERRVAYEVSVRKLECAG